MNTGFVAVLAAVVGAGPPGGNDVDDVDVDMRCGGYCLYISLKALGISLPSYVDFENKLGQPSSSGYSMEKLSDCAKTYEANTLGVVTSVDALRRRQERFACIALINGNHFVNIGSIDRGTAVIYDPPRQYKLPLDTISGQWDGTALLVSMESLAREEDLPRDHSQLARALAAGALVALVLVCGSLFWRRKSARGAI